MTSTSASPSTTPVHDGRSPRRRPVGRRRPASPLERQAVWVAAAASGLGAALAGTSAAGQPVVDVLLAGGFGVLVVHATARARRWTWVVIGGASAVAPDTGLWVAVGAAALALAIVGGLGPRHRAVGAAVAALALQPLLRLPDLGFTGGSAAVMAFATGPALVSAYLMLGRHQRRLVRRVGLAVGVFVLAAALLAGVAALLAARQVDVGSAASASALEAVADGDNQLAVGLFAEAAAAFDRAGTWTGSVLTLPARAVPVLGQQVRAVDAMSVTALRLADAAGEAAEVADPQEFRYTDGRIDLDLVRRSQVPLSEAAGVMRDASGLAGAVGSPWLLPPVRDRLYDLDAAVAEALPSVELADQGAVALPGLLGGEGPRRYLVLFIQPAEARGLGGFIGAWVELTAVDGEVDVTASGRPTDLNNAPGRAERTITGPADYLTRYGRFRPAYYSQDLPFSPDMPTVAQVTAEVYPQAGGAPLDGVIAIDPAGLAGLLEFTGPITLEGDAGQRLTADNAEEYLLSGQYMAFGDDRERRDSLEEAGRTAFDLLVAGDLPAPRRVGTVLGPLVEGRHIRATAFSPQAQALFERVGVDGRIEPPQRDGFMVVTQNKGNNKIDVFLHRTVDYEAVFDPDTGAVQAPARVTLRNDAPASGLPDAIIGNNDQGLPFGTNVVFFSFYTPHALAGARLDGRPFGMEFQRELGFRVFSRFIEIPPGAERVVELELEGRIQPGVEYRLDLVNQPLPNPDMVVARLRASPRWIPVEAAGFGSDSRGEAMVTRIDLGRPESPWVRYALR